MSRLLFDPVAVHVDRLEDAFREIFLLRRWQLGYQKIEEDR